MIGYYEIMIKDKGVMRAVKQIILLLGLLLFFIAALLIVFAIIISAILLVPAVILIIISLIIGSIAHLLTKDYMYIIHEDELIIKRKLGGDFKEIKKIKLFDINAIQMAVISEAVKYTPYNHGITLMTDNKNYSITPDDYMLALIIEGKVVL